MAPDSGRMLSDDPAFLEIAIWVIGGIFAAMTGMLAFIVRREVRRNDALAEKVAELNKFSLRDVDLVLFRAEIRDEFAKFAAQIRHDFGNAISRIDEFQINCSRIHSTYSLETARSIDEVARAAAKAAVEASETRRIGFKGE